jgi:HEAT repeat protein
LAHPVAEEAKEVVRETLMRNLDQTLDRYVRQQCISGLGSLGGEKAMEKLSQIAADEQEDAGIRQDADRALRRWSR